MQPLAVPRVEPRSVLRPAEHVAPTVDDGAFARRAAEVGRTMRTAARLPSRRSGTRSAAPTRLRGAAAQPHRSSSPPRCPPPTTSP